MRIIGLLVVVILGAWPNGTGAEEPRCSWPAGMPRPGLILVGEIHGTNEAPDFVAGLACSIANEGKPLVVALEMPVAEQARIDAYMQSDGGGANREALLEGGFWRRKAQDGRTSTAMFRLIEKLRVVRNGGANLRVLLVDDRVGGSRDQGIAARLRGAVGDGAVGVIALLGNVHASKVKGTRKRPDYEPAGYLLADLSPASIYFSARSWNAWLCAPQCGIKNLKGQRFEASAQGYVSGSEHVRGYDGIYVIDKSTPSRPALEK